MAIVSKKFSRVNQLFYLWSKRREIDIERGIELHTFTEKDFSDINNPLVYEIRKTGIKIV